MSASTWSLGTLSVTVLIACAWRGPFWTGAVVDAAPEPEPNDTGAPPPAVGARWSSRPIVSTRADPIAVRLCASGRPLFVVTTTRITSSLRSAPLAAVSGRDGDRDGLVAWLELLLDVESPVDPRQKSG